MKILQWEADLLSVDDRSDASVARFAFWPPLLAFVVLAFGLAWGAEGVLRAIASRADLDPDVLRRSSENMAFEQIDTAGVSPWLLYLLTRLQDFSFSIAGTVVTFAVGGRRALQRLFDRLVSWQISIWWYAAALLPVLWYLIAIGMAELSSGDVLSSLALTPTALLTMLLSAESGLLVTLFLRGPMGEELGLRGFALVHLQQRYTAFRSAFLLGIVWAIWHLPVLVGRNPVQAVVFLLLALNLSFLFAWLFNRSHGSLIPVLIMHATQNNEETVRGDVSGTGRNQLGATVDVAAACDWHWSWRVAVAGGTPVRRERRFVGHCAMTSWG